ncbi:iron-containing alcohol dehydrogenase [Ruminiclostridium cellobioparum]|uniref:Iron-containing alcohol dehydrogenase n=1 Tax=Ruminiclostridium cellobioparum subsp. termitidis CT1112 TaxID=1195236 RepID=S0FJU3_RUMCE|nr:iron-containing alcohol dehydrogenase [Ruminiclostridium cellobioparum]EMS72435.1 Iron-containing alcohol dehydrogenase [Ruminiclostridium cellobioparum subsp. termitidis CT1112]
MMRPMKLAGSQLMFGQGSLEHLKTLQGKKAFIVTGGSSMKKSGILQKTIDYLKEAGIDSSVFEGVEPDPLFSTVYRGAEAMKQEQPDIIIGLGGGSAMDAAKAMWVYYEHPELTALKDIVPPNPIPRLRNKAVLVCIPSTSGTASEVSRSVVITDDETHVKYGIGNMEMMPDIAICDPEVTVTMPAKITAETGMDALTHALEALVSRRANYLSNILAGNAAKDIIVNLPRACADGNTIEYRETMLNASMVAGLAFTNVSLGIVHSMAHTLGSYFGVSHGLADAIILPFVMKFNLEDETAKAAYSKLAKELGADDLISVVENLNKTIGIPSFISELIPDENAYMEKLGAMSEMALNDGCTKTNPVIPTREQIEALFIKIYKAQSK